MAKAQQSKPSMLASVRAPANDVEITSPPSPMEHVMDVCNINVRGLEDLCEIAEKRLSLILTPECTASDDCKKESPSGDSNYSVLVNTIACINDKLARVQQRLGNIIARVQL